MQVILGIFVGSILSLMSAAVIGLAHLRDQSRRLKIILVGQLNNLSGHCDSSVRSLNTGKRELILRLRMAKYGQIASLDEALSKVGHLNATTIEELIGMSLRVRNNDLELDRAIELVAAGEEKVDLSGIVSRLARSSSLSADMADKLDKTRLPLLWPLGGWSAGSSADRTSPRGRIAGTDEHIDPIRLE